MKIRTLDNKEFIGNSADELCWKLWQSMFKPNKTFKLWMKGSARRAKNWNGARVRTGNAENHLADLIAYNIVTLLEV